MSFLLDTDICSAHLKRPSGLAHRFTQHSGNLFVSAVGLGELYTWAYGRRNPASLLQAIAQDLVAETVIVPFDSDCADMFGRLSAVMRKRGITVTAIDLQIASVALVHNLTVVTHNTADFQNIPNLRLDDWLTP